MNATEILAALEPLGKASYKNVLVRNHGVREPVFGVAISELKKFQRQIRKDYQLALDLYETGNYDAMYLAGLIADDARMTATDLQRWVRRAEYGSLPGTVVASVAAGSPHGKKAALSWIDDKKPHIAAAGWATLAALVSITPDAELDLEELDTWLARAQRAIPQAPDLVRYHVNFFLIAVGTYVLPRTDAVLALARKIGPITADLGNNDCQVPDIAAAIERVRARGSLGKKRKTAKC